MGNKACCDDKVVGGEFSGRDRQGQAAGLAVEQREVEPDRTKAKEDTTNSKHEESRVEVPVKKECELLSNGSEHIELPLLSPEVNNVLKTKNFFKEDFAFQPSMKHFDSDIYAGQLNEQGIPNGFGKLYRADGCLYIGNFQKGKAHGKGALVFSNGSFYHGDFLANHAEGCGEYWSKELEYSGEFKDNFFHGEGKEKGMGHSFRGEYERGNKKQGLFLWKAGNEEYEYFGPFAGNRFEGRGTLKEPKGTYRGDFIKGEKHGRGVYEFLNGLRYEGEYRYGQRSGHGALYDYKNVLAYEGEFQKGFPHGEGVITSEEGSRVAGTWVEGIDEDLL